MAQLIIPITFLELISTRNIKTSMKKNKRQFTWCKAAKQEKAIKQRTKQCYLVEKAQREKYAELHASGKDKIVFI